MGSRDFLAMQWLKHYHVTTEVLPYLLLPEPEMHALSLLSVSYMRFTPFTQCRKMQCRKTQYRNLCRAILLFTMLLALLPASAVQGQEKPRLYPNRIGMQVADIATDATVKYDYDIVYVRAPRKGDNVNTRWAEIVSPVRLEPGSDLMLLHPDGSEEMLVDAGEGAVADPMVSFDGKWIYYSLVPTLKTAYPGRNVAQGADIYKVHVDTRKIVRLTHQEFTPNTGAADWSSDFRKSERGKTNATYGVLNMGPCPLPGGRVIFTSSRDGFKPPKHPSPTMQLFVMDDDGKNVECIGHLNIGMALHPVVLKDGRVMFSSLESQALRSRLLWGLWTIHPDGSNWAPMISAFDTGSAPNAFHFQTQLSGGEIVAEEYYNQNNSGFGAYLKFPPAAADGYSAFGPGFRNDPRNPPLRFGRHYNGKPKLYRLPFSPYGVQSLTRFANNGEGAADPSVLGDQNSAKTGKFTHPSGAPDNHLLTVYSPGPVNHQNRVQLPVPDGGIYLIKDGQPIDEPAQMLLIKNTPEFNEQWPRAVVPYERIYGVKEPARLPAVANDGSLSAHLPAGTPFGLIGTSSFYKRETYPEGTVPEGSVAATYGYDRDANGFRGLDPFNTSQNGASLNWSNQGAEAGVYSNDDIHAVRILIQEPTTDRHLGEKNGRRFYSHANERLRILGEIPLRKFNGDKQPQDPDGNPDTSFLAKIPADTAFTFQTLDKNGMVLNMAQTWHQVRPGEVRTDCGGCHAHSQKPTLFKDTLASKASYKLFDLTRQTPLLTARKNDESKQKWDTENSSGLRYSPAIKNVEYHRDIAPIFERSCVACHTGGKAPASLILDDAEKMNIQYQGQVPGTYYRLAADSGAKFGHKPVIHNGSWRQTNASRYIRKFQSRRSLLVWKIFGRRLDGWTNNDFPTAKVPGDAHTLELAGEPVENTQRNRDRSDLDFRGSVMPPVAAVKSGKVKPLTAEDRLTIVRWIDLGCPVDLDYDPSGPTARGIGWMCDDKRPTLTLTQPKAGRNQPVSQIVIGMHDYYTGLDPDSFTVTADFEIDGVAAGENLASKFKQTPDNVWRWKLTKPVSSRAAATLMVSVKDQQGNVARIKRTFSVDAR